ncbi:MAG: hypothetical protein Q9161_001986 [Pseudevernia consocians]
MADPFSIFAATVGLADVCWRFGSYLYDLQAEAAKIEDEINILLRDIEALKVINENIQASYKALPSNLISSEIESSNHMERLWRTVHSSLENCRLIVEDLEALVTSIVGKKSPKDDNKMMRKLDGFKKQLRKQSREGEFSKLQTRLTTDYNKMQLLLDLIIWTHAQQAHSVTIESLKKLKLDTNKSLDEIKDGVASLQSQISSSEAQSVSAMMIAASRP